MEWKMNWKRKMCSRAAAASAVKMMKCRWNWALESHQFGKLSGVTSFASKLQCAVDQTALPNWDKPRAFSTPARTKWPRRRFQIPHLVLMFLFLRFRAKSSYYSFSQFYLHNWKHQLSCAPVHCVEISWWMVQQKLPKITWKKIWLH